jgi:tetratricopeptide (TPR) repeat protein
MKEDPIHETPRMQMMAVRPPFMMLPFTAFSGSARKTVSRRAAAAIITIGDELLIGQVVNTNQAFLAERLTLDGIAVERMISKGVSALSQGKTEEAIRQFTAALGIDPASSQVRMYLGVALAAAGHPDQGIEKLHEAIRIDPSSPRVQS